eukprot:COSAG06_NODE_2762_length_6327_cov_5.664740_10_plen_56_part_01
MHALLLAPDLAAAVAAAVGSSSLSTSSSSRRQQRDGSGALQPALGRRQLGRARRRA